MQNKDHNKDTKVAEISALFRQDSLYINISLTDIPKWLHNFMGIN